MPKTKPKTKTTATTKKKPAAAASAKAPKKAVAAKTTAKKAAPKKAAAKPKTAAPKKAAVKKAAVKKAAPKKAAAPAKAPKKAAVKKAAPKSSKQSFKKEIYQKLLEAKEKILQEVSQKIKSESNVLKFEIGDIYDIASKERDRELTLMLGDRDREKLSHIENALERIKENTYGECEECGEPIAENRLRALPSTRVCVECQSRNERELKIKGGRFEEDSGLGIMERGEAEDEEF